jgi:nucleoside-diphosphate-sugar epimerase
MKAAAYAPGIAQEDVNLILAQVPGRVWDALRGQRIFISGGTGFVGCWLLEALLAGHERIGLGLQLTVLTRDPGRFHARAPHLAAHPAVTLLAGDMAALDAVNGPFDTIIHAATDVANPGRDPVDVYNAIVRGAEQTLALAERAQARRYLLTSSGAVYGRQPTDCPNVPEDYAGAPDTALPGSAYGQAKRVAEWLTSCHGGRAGLATRIARCFAFLGPYLPLDAHFAVGNFIGDSLAERPVRVGGDGTPVRSYLYAADLAVWLLTILIDGDALPYNVGAEHAIALGDLARLTDATIGGAGVNIGTVPVPGRAPERYVPATGRARALGLREYTDLEAALRRTAAWHRASLT